MAGKGTSRTQSSQSSVVILEYLSLSLLFVSLLFRLFVVAVQLVVASVNGTSFDLTVEYIKK